MKPKIGWLNTINIAVLCVFTGLSISLTVDTFQRRKKISAALKRTEGEIQKTYFAIGVRCAIIAHRKRGEMTAQNWEAMAALEGAQLTSMRTNR